MTPHLKYASIITSFIKNMVLSIGYYIIIIKLRLCVTIFTTGILTRNMVVILYPWSQCILVELLIFGDIENLVTFRREYVCVFDIWSVLIHIFVCFIDIIQHLIHYRIIGVPHSHQAHVWLEGVVHPMALFEEQEIID